MRLCWWTFSINHFIERFHCLTKRNQFNGSRWFPPLEALNHLFNWWYIFHLVKFMIFHFSSFFGMLRLLRQLDLVPIENYLTNTVFNLFSINDWCWTDRSNSPQFSFQSILFFYQLDFLLETWMILLVSNRTKPKKDEIKDTSLYWNHPIEEDLRYCILFNCKFPKKQRWISLSHTSILCRKLLIVIHYSTVHESIWKFTLKL